MNTNPDEAERGVDYEEALARFVVTEAEFDGGLTNHGPMASEALVSIGQEHRTADFVAHYLPRLDPAEPPAPTSGYWEDELGATVAERAGAVAIQAGHGSLRLSHIARGMIRADAEGRLTTAHRQELTAASAYWRSGGPGLPAPHEIDGDRTIEEWAAALPPFPDHFDHPRLLTGTLSAAADRSGFVDAVAALRPSPTPAETLDQLALGSVEMYLRATGMAAFTAIHGVTAPTMAAQLLAFADEEVAHRLVASTAGFVAAAIVGFDSGPCATGPSNDDAPSPGPSSIEGLTSAAADTLDDHTIKFTDACLHLHLRTGSERPLLAAWHRVAKTSPTPIG